MPICENPRKIRNPRYCWSKLLNPEVNPKTNLALGFFHSIGYEWGEFPDLYISVPCGKCFSCLRARMLSYKIRLLSECEHSTNSTFITLTFDDDSLNLFKDNPNKAVLRFLDRVRKRYGKSIRHWICAEYGEKHGRLHYHGILFNYPPDFDSDVLQKMWKYGLSHFGYVNQKTIPYLCKYITKPLTKNSKRPPRIISSLGIGKHLLDDFASLRPKMETGITSKNGVIPLPRYIKTKMYDDFELMILNEIARNKDYVRYVDGLRYVDEDSYVKALKKFSNKQISLSLSQPLKKERKYALKSINNNLVADKSIIGDMLSNNLLNINYE